jgi:hypothetical protein
VHISRNIFSQVLSKDSFVKSTYFSYQINITSTNYYSLILLETRKFAYQAGVVRAWVGQKLEKSNVLGVFYNV